MQGITSEVILIAVVAVCLAACALVYYAAYVVRSQLFGSTIWRGELTSGKVAITFDDGPSDRTDELLNILKEQGVKATFFLVGGNVERFASSSRRIVQEGHEVGNHSFSHPLFLFCSPSKTRFELSRTQEAIQRETGILPRFARPPYGVRTPYYFRAARALGLETIQWTDAGFDWKLFTAKQIADNVLGTAAGGSIILLHDYGTDQPGRQECLAALPLIIDGLRARGLQIVPLADLVSDFDKE